jgi:hypothetical protein
VGLNVKVSFFSTSFMGDKRYTSRVLAGRLTCRWENNIKMDLEEVIWDGVDWIHFAQHRDHWQAHMNMVVNLCVP